jgi:hypothetical protein
MTTAAALVSIQGFLAYLGTVIKSVAELPVAVQELQTRKMNSTLQCMWDQDADLPKEIQVKLMEAFQLDVWVIDCYMNIADKELHWIWVKDCLHSMKFID